MSNYSSVARNPKTKEIEHVMMEDDYFGHYNYGVRFSDGKVYPTHQVTQIGVTELFNALEVSMEINEQVIPGHFTHRERKNLLAMVQFHNQHQSFNKDPKDYFEAQCFKLEDKLGKEL